MKQTINLKNKLEKRDQRYRHSASRPLGWLWYRA